MDKKTLLGITLILAAIGLWAYQAKEMKQQQEAYLQAQREQAVADEAAAAAAGPQSPAADLREATPALPNTDSSASSLEKLRKEELAVLENDFIRVTFTTYGGAIKNVALKQYASVQGGEDPYVFNDAPTGSVLPALSLIQGKPSLAPEQYITQYELVSHTTDTVTFSRTVNGITFVRTYSISMETADNLPYTIQHSTQVINRSGVPYSLEDLYVNVGTAAPDAADHMGFNLNAGFYNGDKYDHEQLSKFRGGGLIFKKEPKADLTFDDSVVWGAVKNQFFTGILTPENPATQVYMKPVDFPHVDTDKPAPKGITESLRLAAGAVPADAAKDLNMSYYVGPKEYVRLVRIGQDQDLVMQFGFFGFFSKLFLHLMRWVQGFVHNWGVAIVFVTVLLRLCMWPLTAKAAKSSKAMQKLQEPMKELREKYKDNPTKLNQEMMKLWKEHRVNPMAGCLPIFIQIPIFISFYYMLRSASELRFAHFLWIGDLSLPDTIAHISNFPINLLPLMMGLSMFYQMRLQPTPTVDNAQVKMMRFMPLIFLFFCYNFSSGLVLYWTTSNLMSILQQLYTNHHHYKDEDQVVEAKVQEVPAASAHRGKANVKKRRKS
ncbi:MAG: membrane protein insertase YidC [Opitutales bacterium]|nr:membrane protein insertase YidC [Opitutales bacterium]